jgi:hypothetical protein
LPDNAGQDNTPCDRPGPPNPVPAVNINWFSMFDALRM